jgi:pimeloyl-ACP methyl ester carboxylesterase
MIQEGSSPIALKHDVAGSGPLLVATHGITEDRTFWNGVPLAAHFRTVRVDLRGHGQSPSMGPYDPLTLATDVRALVDSLNEDSTTAGEHPLVVGHSYGGVVATAYASRFPVRGVVNIDQRSFERDDQADQGPAGHVDRRRYVGAPDRAVVLLIEHDHVDHGVIDLHLLQDPGDRWGHPAGRPQRPGRVPPELIFNPSRTTWSPCRPTRRSTPGRKPLQGASNLPNAAERSVNQA